MGKKIPKVIWTTKKREKVRSLVVKRKKELEQELKSLKSKDKKGSRGEHIGCKIKHMKLLLCMLTQDNPWLDSNTYLFEEYL